MTSQAALFRVLFHNETLFYTREEQTVAVVKKEYPIVEPELSPVVPVAINESVPVDAIKEQTVLPSVPEAGFPALSHKILILTDELKQEKILASELLFLDNILKAVQYSVDQADIINFSFLPGKDARSVLSGKKTNYFITFGVPLIRLHLDLLLVPYAPKLVEGVWFLLTDPLVVIEADRDLKRKLWQALQKMFEKA